MIRQEKTELKEEELWESVRLVPVDDFGKAAKRLLKKLSKPDVHNKGNGVQIHKYRMEGNKEFIEKNWGWGITFVGNILSHRDLADYRKDLKIRKNKLKVKIKAGKLKIRSGPIKDAIELYWENNIFSLSGKLANILNSGCAYPHTEVPASLAWKIATNFVKEAFQNRFDEVLCFDTAAIITDHPSSLMWNTAVSDWFYNMVWDYSMLLLDKKNYEITIIDITDVD
jgi:hypothetical protein